MTYDSTLLGFTVQRHTIGIEDVAMGALCFTCPAGTPL